MQPIHIRSRIVGPNVPVGERIGSGILGAALIGVAAMTRGVKRVGFGGAGVALVVRALSGRCPVYRARAIRREGVRVRKSVTIQGSPRRIYAVWRDLAHLPQILEHVTSVTIESDRVSRWVAEIGGRELVWRAEIVEDTPARRLRWKSLPGGDISTEGEIDIRKAPGDRGTVVDVKLSYLPPGGLVVASALLGWLRKLTATELAGDLARLQQLVETGEITTGARRVGELDDRARIRAARAAAAAPPAITTAQTSTWEPLDRAVLDRGVR